MTLITIIGRGHSGTRAISNTLAASGVFMGQPLNGSWDLIPPQDMYDAAAIAAWFSKGRDSQNVPVDYAPARHVKKPSGAKPGMVIFTNNGTVWIDPKDPESREN